jgi:hypothetical protein
MRSIFKNDDIQYEIQMRRNPEKSPHIHIAKQLSSNGEWKTAHDAA